MKKQLKKNSSCALVIIAVSSLFYLYEFFLRVIPGVLSNEIMADMNINGAVLGLISTCFYFGYIPMQIPAGLLCDRFGPKKLLTFSIAICSLATLLFAYSNSVLLSATARALIGITSAAAFIGPLALATNWFSSRYFALITGIIQLLGCAGAISGGLPIAILTKSNPWRYSVLLAGAAGIILTILFLLFIKDSPDGNTKKKKGGSLVTELARVKQVTKNIENWYTGILAMCCWAPIAIFAELWGVPFLMNLQKIDSTTAAAESAFIWLGIAIGSPIVGWWSDKICSRKTPILTCSIIALISSTILIYAHIESIIGIEILLFCFGAAASSQVVTFGLVSDNNNPEVIGTAIGFNNMAVISGALLQSIVGFIISLLWQGTFANGAPKYGAYEFQCAFLIIPIISLVGIAITVFFIKETGCKKQYT